MQAPVHRHTQIQIQIGMPTSRARTTTTTAMTIFRVVDRVSSTISVIPVHIIVLLTQSLSVEDSNIAIALASSQSHITEYTLCLEDLKISWGGYSD